MDQLPGQGEGQGMLSNALLHAICDLSARLLMLPFCGSRLVPGVHLCPVHLHAMIHGQVSLLRLLMLPSSACPLHQVFLDCCSGSTIS